jgi:hypothetical protein
MAVPNAVVAERPTVNCPILAPPSSHVTLQIETVLMTVNWIEGLMMPRERCFLEAFETVRRKLSAVFRKKIDYAKVCEVRPARLVIDTRTADLRQNLIKNKAAIQIWVPSFISF